MKKTLIKLSLLVIIDVIILWLFIRHENPDPEMGGGGSLVLVLFVPFVFFINLIIAGIFQLFKKKEYVRIFLINSIISAILLYFLWGWEDEFYWRKTVDLWEFVKDDTTFQIIVRNNNSFSFSYSTKPGPSRCFLDGKCVNKNGIIYLTTDSTSYIIENGKLLGFRKPMYSFQLKQLE
jgi:hypothetical protein